MRTMIIAGAFTALTCGAAAATEADTECQIDEARRQARGERVATSPEPPPRAVTRPSETARTYAEAPPPVTTRRRNGKTIPDAELIGRRGAL